jgi:lipopolysaccharide heptosyltransferase II
MTILLVRLRLLGDVVFTTPLLRALRRAYPHAILTYVVEPAAAPVLRGNPHLDDLVVAPRRGGLARLLDDAALGRELRARRIDVAIDLHGGPRSSFLTWASRAPMRIGYAIRGRRWMYTHTVARRPDLAPRHSVLNQWDLLGPLGIGPADPLHDGVEMPEDAGAAARVRERLARLDAGPEHPLVVIHASAGNPFRRWPEASFARVVCDLVRRDQSRRVIITSGPSDLPAARRIAAAARAALGHLGHAVPDPGEFDLPELRALIACAAVYIGGDSGPMHVAATTTTPIVALFGPTPSGRSMPWRPPGLFSEALETEGLPCRPCAQRVCAPGDFRCLTRIEPERVVAAAERAFAAGGAQRSAGDALRAGRA